MREGILIVLSPTCFLMGVNTYLFDFDDTLISTKIYAEIYEPILKMIRKKLKLTNGEIDEKAMEWEFKQNKFGRWDSGDLCRELGLVEEYYNILGKHIDVIPVLHDTVIGLFKRIKSEKKRIGIVSNSMRRTILLYLRKYDLMGDIDFVFSQDDAGCRKNDERFWKKLIFKKKLVVRECLVIGDDPIDDVEVPKKLGFKTRLIKDKENLAKIVILARM